MVHRAGIDYTTSHQFVVHTLNLEVYFADAYSAWQRGVNENTNGLIRPYVLKGAGLNHLTDTDIYSLTCHANPSKHL